MNKKHVAIGLMIFEVLAIFLLYKIISKNNHIVNVNVINKKSITSNSKAKLQYFYEPKAGYNGEEINIQSDLKGTYTINEDSLNETRNYEVERDPKIYRIITLGDSFTYGLGVDTQFNWTERLEVFLNDKTRCINSGNYVGFEVVNLGEGGYDIQYSIERYRLRGEKYNPDLIIWLLKGDDFQEIKELSIPLFNKFKSEHQGLFTPDSVLYAPPLQLAIDEMTRKFGENKILERQESFLDDISTYYKKQLLIFTFNQTQSKYKDIMKKFTNKRPLTYFYDNLVDIYNKETNATFLPLDYHPNIKGHELIANDVFQYLTKNKIIPCSP